MSKTITIKITLKEDETLNLSDRLLGIVIDDQPAKLVPPDQFQCDPGITWELPIEGEETLVIHPHTRMTWGEAGCGATGNDKEWFSQINQ